VRARLLLDSELALWALAAPARLTRAVRGLLDAAEVYVSAATILEIGDSAAGAASGGALLAALAPSGFLPLAVTAEHAALAASLADVGRDPVDRLLVAQATAEGMTLLTTDAALAARPARAAAPRRGKSRRTGPSPAGRRRPAGAGEAATAVPARCPIVLAARATPTRRRRT
jgi:PIN domain nuclease of toxin-antitoxin system